MGKHDKCDINIYNLKDVNMFYGVPSCYTSYSNGISTPFEAFNYGYHNNLDFLFITDVNNFLSKNISYNSKNISMWNLSTYLCRRFSKKKENFVPMIGFETKIIPYGDIDIINSNTFFVGDVENIELLILWMLNNKDAFAILKHPLKSTLSLPYNNVLNKIITSVEVCYGALGDRYIRRDKFFFKLLDKGWKLGTINSQNNTKLDFGDYDNVTGIVTSKLSKSSVIDSFRNRRTFSTESRSLKLFFLANDTLMGGLLKGDTNRIKFSILLEDRYYEIVKIEIISNGGEVVHSVDNLNLNRIKYIYEHIVNKNQSWFVIKIYQASDKISLSSPVFIE
ncbi:histidinol phosphatase [Clostridium sp.]|uniref:histidinol phosphatase n=1 Tax=Clostridium sp. TaxID=1506 RepID=UPI002FCC963E